MSVQCNCDTCGRGFNKPPSQIKRSKRHFCSTECRNEHFKVDVVKNCIVCGEEFNHRGARHKEARRIICSDNCRAIRLAQTLNKHTTGTKISTQGYMYIRDPKHHLADANGYVKRANLVMEEKIGRKLRKGEVVHHIDKDKLNDHPDNLMLFASNADHTMYHYMYDDPRLNGHKSIHN